MNLYSFLSVLSAFTMFFTGLFSIYSNRKSLLNYIFFSVCLAFFIWAIAYANIFLLDSYDEVWFWLKVSAIGWTIGICLLFHFFLLLTERKIIRNIPFLILSYLPGVVYFIRALTGELFLKGMIKYRGVWYFDMPPLFSPWFLSFNIFFTLYLFVSLGSTLHWAITSRHRAIFIQGLIISISGFIVSLLIGLLSVIFPMLNLKLFPPIGHVFLLIWVAAILFGMLRYRLMSITIKNAALDIIENVADSVILFNMAKEIIYINPEAVALFNMKEKELIGRKIFELFPGEGFFDKLSAEDFCGEHVIHSYELTLGREKRRFSISAALVRDRYRSPLGIIAILRDLSELKMAEEKLRFLAMHDSLTELPNRILLHDRLLETIKEAKLGGSKIAVMLVDLDNFKEVNDTMGHNRGDLLLKQMASRLKSCLGKNDTIARFGGDEFVIVLTELMSIKEAEGVCEKLIRAMAEPFILEDRSFHVTISVGVSIYPDHAEAIEALLTNADIAMYQVKNHNKNDYRLYSIGMSETMSRMVSISNELRMGIERGEFELYYQPFINIYSGHIVGVEALVRWNQPDRGLVSPAEFIPIAEKTGLIVPIGEQVLRMACVQMVSLQSEGIPPFPVAVNISNRQFERDDFVDMVKNILEETGLDPDYLHLEITETTVINNIEMTIEKIKMLNSLRIKMLIDDFGAGYTSIMWLRRLPVYAVKIDRFFINSIAEDSQDRAIVKAIISMAHSLKIGVVAEGVESEEQLKALKEIGIGTPTYMYCELAQGYLFSRPLNAAALKNYFRTGRS